MNQYPKRLIEVDLPIKKISEYARNEKMSQKEGHISSLHIWWARRPLVACRAVVLSAILFDPADLNCPELFITKAKNILIDFKNKIGGKRFDLSSPLGLRNALLEFVADFSFWENSKQNDFLEASRNLVTSAYEAVGNPMGTKPLILDPFAGGGAIPFEAMRVGADVYAIDSNPVAVLINKVLLEYLPKYGSELSDYVRLWGEWLKQQAEKEFNEFYPKDSDGKNPITYLWARTIICEGPGCGVEVPLLKSLWLAQKGSKSVALNLNAPRNRKTIEIEILNNVKSKDVNAGTVKRGSVTCPRCGYTTPVTQVREQLKKYNGGSFSARLYAVVTLDALNKKHYRTGTVDDIKAYRKAALLYEKKRQEKPEIFPIEKLPTTASGYFAPPTYGAKTFSDLFNQRQLIFARWLIDSFEKWEREKNVTKELIEPLRCCIALVIDRLIDSNSSQCWWVTVHGETVMRTFGRQSYPIIWDYAEINPLTNPTRGITVAVNQIADNLIHNSNYSSGSSGTANVFLAQEIPLPNDSCAAIITDPPYYDAIPYSDLSDFYQVWLYRLFKNSNLDLFRQPQSKKDDEIVEMARWDGTRYPHKTKLWYEKEMTKALTRSRQILMPDGIMVLVFAHKETTAWEALLSAVIESGWVVTASWPINSENIRRLRAQKSATLESSVHLVCRPRENPDGSLLTDEVGDWRDVLAQLPNRIHDWMPRLALEGIIGADAIFSCLGPALEIFSRYARVEKASGEQVSLREYLEQVWAVVAKEALSMIFAGADTSAFEEDARLTAMWLWTLSTGTNGNGKAKEIADEAGEDEEGGNTKKLLGGYVLEFDAARKIAQGLGAHLEKLRSLVEVKGETARLLPVAERAQFLFGKDTGQTPEKRKKKEAQLNLYKVLELEEESGGGLNVKAVSHLGETVLDRLHQSMIFFAAGRGEALKRFLVEDGVGKDQRFWKLAQAFSALYPSNSDEKRWVDGVLARKKGLGL